MTPSNNELRETVRKKYSELARQEENCCTPSCCDPDSNSQEKYNMIGDAYQGVQGYVPEADLGLGCGLPVEHAGLQPGHIVLDLGSGAGLDAFVARREVGDSGRVIGVDMTADMIARARNNTEQQGMDNVEFRLGEIEHLPVRSGSVDVVISNCVLNLVPDKSQAFEEIFRVLKPGGHFCISDIVSSQALPSWVSSIAEAYAGCVAGAVTKPAYLDMISRAGFESIDIRTERRIEVPADLLARALTEQRLDEAREKDLHVMSITVTALKP